MSPLEDKLKKHAGEIFKHEPAAGHRERFARKMALERKKNRISIRKTISIYAASAVAVLAGFILFTSAPPAANRQNDSYAEVQMYYAAQFENEISAVTDLLEQLNSEDKAAVLKDIEQMKTETARTLQTAGEANIPFVVNLYASKIKVLEHIRDILQ
ncbi:MAG: hypothetical protein LBH90_05360 [Tannerella sp.]|jgi:hypothetical protein|nr:hypothetical protein [Tannerella sp.]